MEKFLRSILLIVVSLGTIFANATSVSAESTGETANDASTLAVTTNVTKTLYYESDDFEYFLNRREDGTSALHVKETIVAVFPDTNVNHGITVGIAYVNQDGVNYTVPSMDALNFSAKRNGVAENIAKTEDVASSYVFYLGNASEYLHGKHTYELEYDFTNVITEYNAQGMLVPGGSNEAAFQELYWDTNGVDSTVKINSLSAKVHIPAEIVKKLSGGAACYVGYQGENGKGRCMISADDETTYNSAAQNAAIDRGAETVLSFETANLAAGENLTFDIGFERDTFVVLAPAQNYTLVIATVVVSVFCSLILLFCYLNWRKNGGPKYHYYKKLFLAPQYQAPKDYFVAEASQLLMKPGKNPYVATLLELAVSGKIKIVKGEPSKILKRETWAIEVDNLEGISDSQEDLLKILNGGEDVGVGEKIQVERHTATRQLAKLAEDFRSSSLAVLRAIGLIEKKGSIGGSVATIIGFVIFGIAFLSFSTSSSTTISWSEFLGRGVIVGKDFLPFIIAGVILTTIIGCAVFSHQKKKYCKYTEKGLDAANYLEGLRLYISMAEAERLKFLQSVKGADTSDKGIVKLYEKLLPYAALFGLEESWLNEFNRYCQEIDYKADWYYGNDFVTFYAIHSIANSVSTNVASSTHYVASSSGSSSSGWSGGGGGGFSGGGGGGGGRGGW